MKGMKRKSHPHFMRPKKGKGIAQAEQYATHTWVTQGIADAEHYANNHKENA